MGLINCPECDKEISVKAKFCPNCGYVNRKKVHTPFYIGGGILITIIFAFILFRGHKPLGMDKELYNLGVSALEIIDDYIDAKITGKEAIDKLDNISNRLDRVDSFDSTMIRIDIYNASVDILLGRDVTEKRNKIASHLNKSKR